MSCEATVATAAPATPHGDENNEDDIEHNIDDGRDDEDDNRRAAVADSALDAGKHIIEERCGDAGKNDNKVRVSVVDDIRRRVHEL